MRRGEKLVCRPCGREVSIDACGISETALWCCGRPMRKIGQRNRQKTKKADKK